MTLATAPETHRAEFVVEDITTGVFANGFGHLGDGRTFAFHLHRGRLEVEIYRARLARPVPLPEDVVAVAIRNLTDLDIDDERSLAAAVRDAIADAVPVR
ncbi:MAG: hypothetical protein KDB71_20705 [Mycobacterium sp.]|nr:hypothetical protein [Mycobacterium sp.]